MDRRLPSFLRAHPRLLNLSIFVSLLAVATVVAYLGLQVHVPSRSRAETFLEWTVFLAALGGCLIVLLGGARLRRLARPVEPDPDKPGTPDSSS